MLMLKMDVRILIYIDFDHPRLLYHSSSLMILLILTNNAFKSSFYSSRQSHQVFPTAAGLMKQPRG